MATVEAPAVNPAKAEMMVRAAQAHRTRANVDIHR